MKFLASRDRRENKNKKKGVGEEGVSESLISFQVEHLLQVNV